MKPTLTPSGLASALVVTALLCVVPTFPVSAQCGTETDLKNTVPGWYYRMPTGTNSVTNNLYLTVDSAYIGETNLLFLGGVYMPAGMEDIMNMRGLAFRSQDSGATVQDVSGSAVGAPLTTMCTPADIDIVIPGLTPPQPTVWVSCGSSLALSADGGTFNRKFDAPAAGDDQDQINCIHMFDGSRGVAGAESGKIYIFELSQDGKSVAFTTADIDNHPSTAHPSAAPAVVAMHWPTGNSGWAVAVDGEVLTESDYEGNETEKQMYYQARVFNTTDGGLSWELLSTVDLPSEDPVHQIEMMGKTYPLSFEGGWLPREIRMVDVNNGFMTLVAWDATKQQSVVAKILKTENGGRNWTDMEVNMQVGTLESMFVQPIFISDIAGTLFWKNDDGSIKGRVAGAAFVAEGGSSGGTPPKYYYLATLDLTGDGAWTKYPELGTVQMDMTGAGTVPTTPRPLDAVFLDRYNGFAVGEKGTVFRFRYKCTKQSECDFGYYCNPDELTCLSCADIGLTDHVGSIEKCAAWTPPPEDSELAGRDAWEPGDGDAMAPVDATGGQDLAGWNANDPDGCNAGRSGQMNPVLILIVLAGICFVATRARFRGGHLPGSSIGTDF